MDTEEVIEQVFRLYEDLGQSQYLGEEVTKTEHSMQCAMAAKVDGASDQVSRLICSKFELNWIVRSYLLCFKQKYL